MATIKSASRYNSFDSRSSTQSHQSDPSSSTDLTANQSLKRLGGGGGGGSHGRSQRSSHALARTKSSDVAQVKGRNEQNLGAMVKKFMEKRSKPKAANGAALMIPADFIAEDLKKTARKGTNFGGLHRKLFSKGSKLKDGTGGEVKALTEVKANTRTLAMVLRSERELLSLNKEQEDQITELKLTLEEKSREVTYGSIWLLCELCKVQKLQTLVVWKHLRVVMWSIQ